jgi:hypothetical protein
MIILDANKGQGQGNDQHVDVDYDEAGTGEGVAIGGAEDTIPMDDIVIPEEEQTGAAKKDEEMPF